ncbi:MAG: triose-phosphate isomerase [Chloroflexi bacterium]|nr:triose-phosphate isomerase [Chloroflexota bacterium]MDA1270320.1 triose-phosphate isomerase [Chloroflexota bacterium]
MPDLVVAGNWKMNTTLAEATALAAGVRDGAASVSGVKLVLCPPFISLAAVSDAVKGSAVKVGAQNMHFQDSGAFTGEVSPLMLRGLCDYVIIGHSERRQMFGETDGSVNSKVKAAQAAGLKPILCVGETLEQREQGQASDIISGQVRAGLDGVSDSADLIVAYEPIWAIGTGQAATPETAAEIMGGAILETLRSLFATAAENIPLLYGGSMNGGNAGDFAAQSCIHGGLVGGAALQADQFIQVAAAVAGAKS